MLTLNSSHAFIIHPQCHILNYLFLRILKKQSCFFSFGISFISMRHLLNKFRNTSLTTCEAFFNNSFGKLPQPETFTIYNFSQDFFRFLQWIFLEFLCYFQFHFFLNCFGRFHYSLVLVLPLSFSISSQFRSIQLVYFYFTVFLMYLFVDAYCFLSTSSVDSHFLYSIFSSAISFLFLSTYNGCDLKFIFSCFSASNAASLIFVFNIFKYLLSFF